MYLAVSRAELLPRVPQRGVEQGARVRPLYVPQDRIQPPGTGRDTSREYR